MNDGRNFDGDPDIYAVTACQGQGKSTVHREIIRNAPVDHHFIFDHKGQFSRLLPMFECRTREQCVAALRDNRAVCFNPATLYEERHEEAFDDFCAWVWKVQKKLPMPAPGRKKLLLSFDEGGDLLPIAYTHWLKHNTRKFTNTGREWGCDLAAAAQAPTDFPLKFRNQVNHWFVGKLGDPACLDPLKKHGFNWDSNQRLRIGQFQHFNKKNGAFADYRTRKES